MLKSFKMSLKDIALFLLTIFLFELLVDWNVCLITFCKFGDVPDWLRWIYFLIPIPLFGGVFISLPLILPLAMFCDKYKSGLITCIFTAFVVSVLKYLPNFDPSSDYYNVFIDWVLAAIVITLPFRLIYGIRQFMKSVKI